MRVSCLFQWTGVEINFAMPSFICSCVPLEMQNTGLANNTFCVFFFLLLFAFITVDVEFVMNTRLTDAAFSSRRVPVNDHSILIHLRLLTCDVLAVCFVTDLTPHGPRADCDPHFCLVF